LQYFSIEEIKAFQSKAYYCFCSILQLFLITPIEMYLSPGSNRWRARQSIGSISSNALASGPSMLAQTLLLHRRNSKHILCQPPFHSSFERTMESPSEWPWKIWDACDENRRVFRPSSQEGRIDSAKRLLKEPGGKRGPSNKLKLFF
jgi:hypothetical protein